MAGTHQAFTSFNTQSYSETNKPSVVTLQGDISNLETYHNAHDADESIHVADASAVVTKTGSETLTNKTLTSPKINEDVALTTTATELNLLHGNLGAWTSWTPSWTNLTVGNGTVTAKYTQVGKIVIAMLSLTLGTTSSVGNAPKFTIPVTCAWTTGAIGRMQLTDQGTRWYDGIPNLISNTTIEIDCINTASTYAGFDPVTASVPFTWTTTDIIFALLTYEAA